MKKKHILCILLSVLSLYSCTTKNENSIADKHYKKWDKVVNIKDKVKKIQIDDTFIGNRIRLYIYDNYLFIVDYNSYDQMIHAFDKNTYAYINSFVNRGQGPNEIVNIGSLAWNNEKRELYVTDFGQYKILAYEPDKALRDSTYTPSLKAKMQKATFPDNYQYVNDTLTYGTFIIPTSVSTFNQTSGRWNMKTGEVTPVKDTHPEIKIRRLELSASIEHNLLVETYANYDLIRLYDLDGKLKCNIYGPAWNPKHSPGHYFTESFIHKDKIIVEYDGDNWREDINPSVLHVFTLEGDYIKTLETGVNAGAFCYDKDNGRLLFCIYDDEENRFAYIDLDKVL